MTVAVGTSLLVITMKSFAGLSGYLFSVQLNWPIVLAFTATANGATVNLGPFHDAHGHNYTVYWNTGGGGGGSGTAPAGQHDAAAEHGAALEVAPLRESVR